MKTIKAFLTLFIANIFAFLTVNHASGAQTAGTPLENMLKPKKANDFFQGSNDTRGIRFLNGGVSDFLYRPTDGTDFFSYAMKIVNLEKTDETIILNPSYDPSSANSITDGAFLSIDGAGNDLNATGDSNGRTIAAFKAWIKKNPSLCVGVNIETDNTKQLSKSIKLIYRNDPFNKNGQERLIRFSDWKDNKRFQDLELLVGAPFVWDDQTEIQLVCAGSGVEDGDGAAIAITTTYTWKFKYCFSTELAFRTYALANL